MTKPNLILNRFYYLRNDRKSHINEKWDIKQQEWIEFFTNGEGRGVLEQRGGTGRVGRRDEAAAWTIANLVIINEPTKWQCERVINRQKLPEKEIEEEAIVPARTLTTGQWIAELRAERGLE